MNLISEQSIETLAPKLKMFSIFENSPKINLIFSILSNFQAWCEAVPFPKFAIQITVSHL